VKEVRWGTSIGARLLRGAVLSTSAALVVVGVLFAVHDYRSFREALVRRLEAQADIVGQNCAAAVLFDDREAALATLQSLHASAEVVGAALYGPDGKARASWVADGATSALPRSLPAGGEADRMDDDGLSVVRRVEYGGRYIGDILVRSDLREIRGRLRGFAALFAGVWALSLVAAVLVAHLGQRAILRPVRSLITAARMVTGEGDYSVKAEGEGPDELGLLVRAFNEMLSGIHRRDAELNEARATLERRVEERTLALSRELDERRRAEEQVRELNSQNEARLVELSSLNREMEAFSYSVSHDLRAPLRHIGGFVDLLRTRSEEFLDATSKRYLDVIADGARRMGGLIDDLLAFSRTSRSAMTEADVNLYALVREVAEELTRDAGPRDICWTLGSLPVVVGDPSMLRLAFVNLLSNAVKYTKTRPRADIEVNASPGEDGDVVVTVKDNGVGFDMRYSDKLFGVFQRLHRSEDFEGTGIGLATVQRIVHRHGGRVWAHSTPDVGTTFSLTLRTPRRSHGQAQADPSR